MPLYKNSLEPFSLMKFYLRETPIQERMEIETAEIPDYFTADI